MLIIDETHVKCACQFLRMIYSKQSMAYDMYSNMATTSSSIDDTTKVGKVFNSLGDFRKPTITGLLELNRISADNLADYTGDISIAKSLIGELVRLRCLNRSEGTNWYLKNPAFSQWLRRHSKIHHKERKYYGTTVE